MILSKTVTYFAYVFNTITERQRRNVENVNFFHLLFVISASLPPCYFCKNPDDVFMKSIHFPWQGA